MIPAESSGYYGAARGSGESDEEAPRVVVRDKRRIDPVTGAVREKPAAPPPGSTGTNQEGRAPAEPVDDLRAQDAATELAERIDDLQRVSAEYANYRRRVDRDRVLIGELAQERLVLDLLPVLDDIDRARDHGDLTGAFKSTADQLVAVLGRVGVQSFGQVGDAFDPAMHEAVLHSESAEVSMPTCTHVMRPGYRRGERVLRAAMVGVADPELQAPIPFAATESPGVSTEDSTVEPTVESPVETAGDDERDA